eukprot:scaffold3769_cov164-Skeletonema_dohrnii-CCMP3373.AAC.2
MVCDNDRLDGGGKWVGVDLFFLVGVTRRSSFAQSSSVLKRIRRLQLYISRLHPLRKVSTGASPVGDHCIQMRGE